jgi:hypothetical protein
MSSAGTQYSSLPRAIGAAGRWVRVPAALLARAAAADPLRIDLPPLLGPEAGAALTADAMRRLAALYLYAELEQAGVIPVAAWLAEARYELHGLTTATARRLEAFAQRQRSWPDRPQRERLFARLFGTASGGGGDAAPAANRAFPPLFAALCAELAHWADEPLPSAAREAALRAGAGAVTHNLAPHQFGNTAAAAAAIHTQLEAALAILGDPDLGALVQARGPWNTLRALLGSDAPDLGRLITRGQSGLAVLTWLGSALGVLAAATGLLVTRDSPVVTAAARWLVATGLPAAAGGRR